MLQNGYYDDNEILIPVKKKSTRKALKESNDIEELAQTIMMAVNEDKTLFFSGVFVNVPIESMASDRDNNSFLNGTRLTISNMNDGRGLEFSICHSSTPDRFRQYETELSFVFDKIVNSLVKLRRLERECTADMTDEVHIITNIEETKEITEEKIRREDNSKRKG